VSAHDDRREFTRHMIRLRHASQIEGGEANEIILLNSHDGTSSHQVSPHNVRVVLIAPAACNTELQTITTNESIKEGFAAWKESLGGVILQPQEVAQAIRFAYEMPQNVCIRELMLASTNQPV